MEYTMTEHDNPYFLISDDLLVETPNNPPVTRQGFVIPPNTTGIKPHVLIPLPCLWDHFPNLAALLAREDNPEAL